MTKKETRTMAETMTGKTLQETMPDLRTVSFITDNADRIIVEKMTMTRSRDRMRIYLEAPFLIQKNEQPLLPHLNITQFCMRVLPLNVSVIPSHIFGRRLMALLHRISLKAV